MPTYEYLCSDCGHEWEAFQSIKEAALTVCDRCGKQTAQRRISGGAGFILKGGGWYSDLYGSSRGGSGKKDEGGPAKSESAKSESAKSNGSAKPDGGSKAEAKKPAGGSSSTAPPAKE